MLQLPATPHDVYVKVWQPALLMLPAKMRGLQSDVLGIAIGKQESGYDERDQVDAQRQLGPALGLWQFERGGGVKGVNTHPATRDMASALCSHFGVAFTNDACWRYLAQDDEFAALYARLLLWTAPQPLPTIGDEDGAWDYYTSLWRPGEPDRERWRVSYPAAVVGVRGY